MKPTDRNCFVPITLVLLWMGAVPLTAQCVPEMNEIREEIRSIHVQALEALRQQAADAAADGWQAVAKGKRKQAQQRFERALALDPDCWDARAGLAHLAFADNHPGEGMAAYRASRALFEKARLSIPDRLKQLADCRSRLAVVLKRLDRHQSMYNIQDKGESYDPSHQEAVVRAMDEWIAGQVAALQALVETGYPVRLLRVMGADLARHERWTEAATVYREALAAAPDDGVSHANLAACLLALNQPDAARRHALRAKALGVTLHPDLAARLHIR